MQIPTFTVGRDYEARFTFKRFRELSKIGVDIDDETKTGNLVMLLTQTGKLGESLWIVAREQAAAAGVTQDQFFEALDGDAMAAGWEAICEAYINFQPENNRAKLRTTIGKQLDTIQEASQQVVSFLESEEFEAEKQTQLAKVNEQLISTIRGEIAS
jgi:hypothetical protein